jgi:uncharacterized membrane protein YkvA (DUF1232 family)
VSRGAWIVLGLIAAVVVILTLVVAVRLVMRMVRVKRVLAASGASGKWVFWGAIAYWIFPIDLLPDPIYLDDIGVLAGALIFLTRLAKKQTTLNEGMPHLRQVADVAARRRRGAVGGSRPLN